MPSSVYNNISLSVSIVYLLTIFFTVFGIFLRLWFEVWSCTYFISKTKREKLIKVRYPRYKSICCCKIKLLITKTLQLLQRKRNWETLPKKMFKICILITLIGYCTHFFYLLHNRPCEVERMFICPKVNC